MRLALLISGGLLPTQAQFCKRLCETLEWDMTLLCHIETSKATAFIVRQA